MYEAGSKQPPVFVVVLNAVWVKNPFVKNFRFVPGVKAKDTRNDDQYYSNIHKN